MAHVDDRAEGIDYNFYSDAIANLSDSSDDDDDDDNDEFQFDSNGFFILNEDHHIKMYIAMIKATKFYIGRLDEHLQSGLPEALEWIKSLLTDLETVFTTAKHEEDALLEKGLQDLKMQAIHRMNDHVATTISEIKADIAAFSEKCSFS